jgi:glycosyltransferase involved in cell wall biosynthesis
VMKKGGRAIVLHDKIPTIELPRERIELPNGRNILFVCTFASDEPVAEVISSARNLGPGFNIHITGNYRNGGLDPSAPDFPENIHLLGFVSNELYEAYMYSCDVILVLTTAEWVIVCGGYEAVALGKPLVTSNTRALKEFFQGKALHTDPNPDAIAKAIRIACEDAVILSKKIEEFCRLEDEIWNAQWAHFLEEVSALCQR